MGITSFFVPQPDRLTAQAVSQCYMQGIEEVPWQSSNTLKERLLSIQRASSDSGQLYIPWPVTGRGRVTLCTTCLRESEEFYHLPLELARGTVGRLRNQVEHWRQMEVPVPDAVLQRTRDATRSLRRSATAARDSNTVTQAAEEAITEALDAIELLMQSVSSHALAKAGKRNIFMAANLGARSGHKFPEDLLGAVNTIVVPFAWSEVEGSDSDSSEEFFSEQIRWSQRLGLRICGGPLLNFNSNGLPDWLYLWEEDYESLQSYMVRYVESVVRKFSGSVNLWHAWAGINSGQAMNLSEEFRLRVAVAALETLNRIDGSTPTFVSFSQPFGEYLSRQALDLAPIHYADTLIRAELGISGLGLELNLGYWPHGTLPRDILEIHHLIDRWSSFGLPLVLILNWPSEELADDNDCVVMPTGADQSTPDSQAQLATDLIRSCLSKPMVQGVIWNQLVDADLAAWPHAGLFTENGAAKPILDNLKQIRKTHLL